LFLFQLGILLAFLNYFCCSAAKIHTLSAALKEFSQPVFPSKNNRIGLTLLCDNVTDGCEDPAYNENNSQKYLQRGILECKGIPVFLRVKR
jgi:hypothetical protein